MRLPVLEVDRIDDRFSAVQLQRRCDDRRFGAVYHQRSIHRRGEAMHHFSHLSQFVAADEGGAYVERMRAFAQLLSTHRDAAIPVVLLLMLAPLLRTIRVASLA